ncbi:MAG TPA: hypothetical protein VGS19_21045 [Streptosporangiaceae bacterium]|nr:hypothetical protein [Streptosporangiaceae bacterium]
MTKPRDTQSAGLHYGRRRGWDRPAIVAAAAALAAATLAAGAASALAAPRHAAPTKADAAKANFGPNVKIFNPTMSVSQIQSTVNSIANQQVGNQFGTQRYALLFEPGTYGSPSNPLDFQVGYYTEVAGLGASPRDTVIYGAIDSFNQGGTALVNFWRSVSNLTINVAGSPSCQGATEVWAVSQAAPMRRVQVNGNATFQDSCSSPGYSSGGFVADSVFTGGGVTNGSQQQFIVRNSNLDGWSNGVWNQVFSGDNGAPAQSFGSGNPYTTLASSPVTEESPFLYTGSNGSFNVFVPSVQHNTVGPSWASGQTPGTSRPLSDFFIATPSDSAATINAALNKGKDLLLTPGVYSLGEALNVTHADTVVLGLGFPTLVPSAGNIAVAVSNVAGVRLSGMIFDAGPKNSGALLKVGTGPAGGSATDPDLVSDAFFRIGGATAGMATDALVVDSSNTIIDDIWAWRADHGSGVGWNSNVSHSGLVVNGNNVTAYGLFIEHNEKTQVVWNGQGGTDIFFQDEMPYDVPSQSAWMENAATDGYPAFKVAPKVTSFQGYGMGSYCFFNQGVDIFASRAFESPNTPGVAWHDLLTVFLTGSGGIDHVINNTGGSATSANPDTGVDVVSYP